MLGNCLDIFVKGFKIFLKWVIFSATRRLFQDARKGKVYSVSVSSFRLVADLSTH